MNEIINWLNQNQGVVTVIVFITTLIIAWLSGFFKFLRNRPKLKIEYIDGPNFCCKIKTDKSEGNEDGYRTAISIYLKISNLGSAPTSISKIKIKYKCNVLKWENLKLWKKFSKYEYKIDRFKSFYSWELINHPTTSLEEFKYYLNDEKIKVYPFLIQHSYLIPFDIDLYLEQGKIETGVVYFESIEYWGGYEPKVINEKVQVKVLIFDTYNKKYKKILKIPFAEINEAKKYNASFGETFKQLKKD